MKEKKILFINLTKNPSKHFSYYSNRKLVYKIKNVVKQPD